MTDEKATLNHDTDRNAEIRHLADRDLDTVSGGLWPAALAVGIALVAVGYAIGHD